MVLMCLAGGPCTPGCGWAKTLRESPRAGSAPAHAASAPVVTVTEPLGVARTHWPLSTGVPFPPGAVRDVAQLSVAEAQTALPTQSRVLSRWPDGSVRW